MINIYIYIDQDNTEVLARVAELLNNAKKPILYSGQGILQSGGSNVLRELAIKGFVFPLILP